MAWLLFGRAPSGIIHDTKSRLQKPPSRHRAVTTAACIVTPLDVSRTVTGIEDLKPFGPLVVTHGSGVCWLQPSQPENSTAKTGSGKIPEAFTPCVVPAVVRQRSPLGTVQPGFGSSIRKNPDRSPVVRASFGFDRGCCPLCVYLDLRPAPQCGGHIRQIEKTH